MRVKCIKNIGDEHLLTLGKIYNVLVNREDEYRILSDDNNRHSFFKNQFEIIEEPAQIIDVNGIQTEPFTHEQKKVIAVEKDLYKAMLWQVMLTSFKTADELQRIALLEIFEEMCYPQTDMVKLYRTFQDEL